MIQNMHGRSPLLALLVLAIACSSACSDDTPRRAAPVSTTTTATTSPRPLSRQVEAATAPGTANHECVDLDPLRQAHRGTERLDVRSGDLLAGNFRDLVGRGSPGDPDFAIKVYWVPLADDQIPHDYGLAVTVQSLSDPALAPTIVTFGGGTYAPDIDGGYVWTSGVPLPAHGRWRLQAEAPSHWGCFLLSM